MPTHNQLALKNLIVEIAAGNPDALDELLRSGPGLLGGRLGKFALDRNLEPDEVRAEARAKWLPGSPFWHTLSESPETSIEAYVTQCLKNLCKDMGRSQTRSVQWDPLDEHTAAIAVQDDLTPILVEEALSLLGQSGHVRCEALLRLQIQGEKLQDIADAWAVTPGRISQIRTENLKFLREQAPWLDPGAG